MIAEFLMSQPSTTSQSLSLINNDLILNVGIGLKTLDQTPSQSNTRSEDASRDAVGELVDKVLLVQGNRDGRLEQHPASRAKAGVALALDVRVHLAGFFGRATRFAHGDGLERKAAILNRLAIGTLAWLGQNFEEEVSHDRKRGEDGEDSRNRPHLASAFRGRINKET